MGKMEEKNCKKLIKFFKKKFKTIIGNLYSFSDHISVKTLENHFGVKILKKQFDDILV